MSKIEMNRRDVLKSLSLSSGFAVAAQIPFSSRLVAAPATFRPNAWIHLSNTGDYTFFLDKAEMGQGVIAGLPTIAAEELDIDPSLFKIEFAPVAADYANADFGIQQTGGSTSTKTCYAILRQAAASAKATLVAAAAKSWGVPESECKAKDGIVHHTSGKQLAYKDLVDMASSLELRTGNLKDPSTFRYIGKPLARPDNHAKVTGQAVFGIDFQHPDLVNAVVIRPPSFSGKSKSFDASQALLMPGVLQIFAIKTGIAVVAQKFWQAKTAAASVKVEWERGDIGDLSSAQIAQDMRAMAKDGDEVRNDGDVAKAFASTANMIDVEYDLPYLAHAPMEPVNCTAYLTKSKCTIWAPTQGAGPAQQFAAEESGLDHDQIEVHTLLLGGSFGRKLQEWDVKEAVAISRQMKKPVKVTWTREDDMQQGFFRPANYHRMRACIDVKTGMPEAWEHQIVCPSIMGSSVPIFTRVGLPQGIPEWMKRFSGWVAGGVYNLFATDQTSIEGASDLPYAIPNLLVSYAAADPGIPIGFWRSVGYSQNGFVTESFLDELAHAAGKDPYQYRRQLLQSHPRHLHVLDLAAEQAGWGKPLPEGHFHGIAQQASFGSYVAQVLEVSVLDNQVTVHKVTCAIDCGQVINPDSVRAQIEGGVIFGLTAALHGNITITKGGVQESNFHTYPLLRMNECPKFDVHIVDSREKPMGVGEPGTPPAAPALTNAIFAATGKRIRRLPIDLDTVSS